MSECAMARRRGAAVMLALELLLLTVGVGVARGTDGVGEESAGRTPVASLLGPDFVDIGSVRSGSDTTAPSGARVGSYTWDCGRNDDGHRNTANVVTAPGYPGQAHHVHDYVGNVSTDVGSTPERLASAATTCRNGDRSTYYWPVLRTVPAAAGGAGHDGHEGEIQVPAAVTLTFTGNPSGNVVAMPARLDGTVGDAVAVTNGGTHAAATWTCSSTPDRRTTAYPVCPAGDRVLRVFDFPSCWDGRRLDSETHRAHLVFPARDGSCPHGTFPVPRLRLTLAYDLPPGVRFRIDAFDGQRNSPLTDHAFFLNLMPEPVMARVVACLNAGQTCQDSGRR
ncbi:DUF1996 domain-containing protein [Micromonospora costi]|uniref:DUF1996 domain-containing protein n=1 Tax=Micromonospora costi TaxID=1530042 RepID=A0A3A9ZTG8_9ACTN|nr:DUF1996 domain-containing protein [Micromonospora costi]RKN51578.1 DUF1996 domain-containing protein [Micromonospora costi]